MYQPIRVQYFTVGENSGTSKEARDFKIDTELPGDMHTASKMGNTPLTLVRNQVCLVRLLIGRRYLGNWIFFRMLETAKLAPLF